MTLGPDQVAISVIIPCYNSAPWLRHCLRSLSEQTLSKDLFEAVLVFNGPDDGGEALARTLLAEFGIRHRIVHSAPGASTARNVGTQEATGLWHTFLDIDDELSANYLAELWAAAKDPHVIPLATMVDVLEDGTERESPLHTQISSYPGRASPSELWRPLSVTVLKLLPAELSRRHPFDPDLKSGEDVALFFQMFNSEELDFDTSPAQAGATYRRLIRAGSVSRAGDSYDFMVTQRLQVIQILEAALTGEQQPRLGDVIKVMIRSQAGMVRKFAQLNPRQLGDVHDDIEQMGLVHFPTDLLPSLTDRLIVAYAFVPFNDPSSLVSLKRAIVSGHKYNAISADMSDRRTRDRSLAMIADQVIQHHLTVPGPTGWDEWEPIDSFCEGGLTALAEIESIHPPQKHVYSRAVWPASHFLAALIKGRRPTINWTAEFSDPLRKNVFGGERPGNVEDTAISRELTELVAEAGWPMREGATLFEWAEHVPYALADTLVFTNPHQLTFMLGYLEDSALREHVLNRAVIKPQPTLSAEYYERGGAPIERDPQVVDLAYFGSFYPTRGLGDVLEGLRLLAPDEAAQIRLHVFSQDLDKLGSSLDGHPYRSRVTAYHPLPYLRFLRAAKSFDVLIVNDAATMGSASLNPYLPSKLSDYLGAGVPIWGIVETGSMLSLKPLDHKSPISDPVAASKVLRSLIRKDHS